MQRTAGGLHPFTGRVQLAVRFVINHILSSTKIFTIFGKVSD